MMKTKPIIIAISCIIVIVCAFFFVKAKYYNKPDKKEITQFLIDFNNELQSEQAGNIFSYFQAGKNNKSINLLVKVLSGKTGLNGKSAPLFKINLNTENIKIISNNSEIIVAEVPVSFFHDSIDTKGSVITFIIHKTADQYKIVKVNTAVFLKEYIAYENLVRIKTEPAQDIFSAITLASFKMADKLKTRYDSVIWFDHVNGQTYYYVVKGKWDSRFLQEAQPEGLIPDCKMGLADPDLKEIIPPDYDLIHNINGTIDGLIEVEKNNKRGFYNLTGKLMLPVIYDQIYPLKNNANLALLFDGNDYFYLKNDTTITNKVPDFKIADLLPYIKTFGDSYTLCEKSSKDIMEYNVRDYNSSIVIPPSYLVDLQIMPISIDLPNPLRKSNDDDGDGSVSLEVKFDDSKKEASNWFESAFYSLYNDYLGARAGLYESKDVLIADKKQNRLLGYSTGIYYGSAEGDGLSSDLCHESSVRAINDSLFEFTTSSEFDQPMLQVSIDIGPYYHYLAVKNGKLEALPNQRVFGCTKYVKLDDSYMQGCYVVNGKAIDRVTSEMLRYMKNEIYGSYGYKFKDSVWNQDFDQRFNQFNSVEKNTNVDDSLTTIDKYNINWINQKLKSINADKVASIQ